MEGMPVTLIVKAPNQQIEDQTIKCELSWTIRRLKGYLSEVYPSKPHTDEQKLIYSGQLLPDTVVLKDVLRRYEGQETHTVHLVCAPSREMYTQKSPVKQKTEIPSSSTNTPQENPVNTNENQSETNTSLPSTSTATVQQPDNSNANEIRHRFISSSSGTEIPLSPGTNSRTWAESLTQPYIHTFEGDPNAFALQMAWMQQAYVNYMAQYMQLYTPNSHVNSVSLPATENNQENINVQPAAENAQVNNVPAPVIDALANDPEDGGHDRDWLDWIYMLSRLAIFFSIVYFYSSPLRFIVVVLLGITIYLYGFFRNQPLENNVNNNINEPGENNNIVDGQNAANRENASNNGAGNAVPILEDRPSLPAVMWTFFTTFFASLIPEVPNAV